jgi:hypothetical protein
MSIFPRFNSVTMTASVFPDPVKNAGSIFMDQGQAWYCDGTKWIRGLPPGSNITATGPGTFNVNAGTGIVIGGAPPTGTAPPTFWWEDVGMFDFGYPEGEEPVCECGSEKVGSPSHSSWCPKTESK